MDKATSTILVAYDSAQRLVVYNESTRFTRYNRAGSLDEVKAGRSVICRGKLDSDDRLIASRVEVRDEDK